MTTLQNPSFEGITRPGGWTRDTHAGVEYGEIFVPEGWVAWWQEGVFRRPEMKVIQNVPPFNDPPRIYDGDWAFQSFTMFGRQHAGLYQVVAGLTPGGTYELSAQAHAWSLHPGIGEQSPYCSSGVGCGAVYIPEGDVPGLNDDPESDAMGNFAFRVGVSYGDPDPEAVDWGAGAHVYNAYREVPPLRFIAPANGKVTIYLCATSVWNFKTSDAYWDKVALKKVDDDDTPPPEGRGQPRMQYERTYILLPQNCGEAWALAAVEGGHAERRTVGYSADDAGIGDLDVRKVIAVNPDEWPSDLEAFFNQYYPGIHYAAIEAATPDELREKLSGPFDPGPPPGPPQPPPYDGPLNLIDPHMQTIEPGVLVASQVAGRSPLMQKILSLYYTWQYNRAQNLTRQTTFKYVRDAKPNYVKVFSFEDVYGGLRAYPGALVGVRHFTNDYGGMIDVEPALGARRWVDLFRGALYTTCDYINQNFPNIKKPYFFMEGPNELVPSHNAPLVKRALDLDLAICLELERTGLPIASIGYCAGVGNPHESEFPLIVPLARELERTGGALGLHLYWWANKNESGVASWWKYHAGRYQEVDKELVRHGIHVDWLCGESGVVASEDGGHHLNAHSGWRDVMTWDRYLDDLLTVNQWDNEWNVTHEGRMKGRSYFTTCATFCNWFPFRLTQKEFEAIAAALLERYS